jgi:hypothetical protein
MKNKRMNDYDYEELTSNADYLEATYDPYEDPYNDDDEANNKYAIFMDGVNHFESEKKSYSFSKKGIKVKKLKITKVKKK